MRKEVVSAIIIGFVLGLLITFGVWTANKALKQKPQPSPEEITPKAQLTPAPSLFLEIISPEDNAISSEAKITLSGKTQPGAMVVIIGEKGEEIVEVSQDGSFSGEMTLVSGINEITVTAFSPEGDQVSKNLSLVYSTAEI